MENGFRTSEYPHAYIENGFDLHTNSYQFSLSLLFFFLLVKKPERTQIVRTNQLTMGLLVGGQPNPRN